MLCSSLYSPGTCRLEVTAHAGTEVCILQAQNWVRVAKPRLTMAPAKSKLGCGVSQCWSTWLSVYEALGWILSPRGVKVRHRYLCPESSGGGHNLSGLHHYPEPRHTVRACAHISMHHTCPPSQALLLFEFVFVVIVFVVVLLEFFVTRR